jgi:putative NADH-flavin reductase
MRITVFGAAGTTGRRIVAEALTRGHEVTAVVRDTARFAEVPSAAIHRVGDATDVANVVELSTGQDVVVTATRPAPGHEHELVVVAKAMLTALSGTGVRLLAVGDAGSLTVPGSGGTLAVDDPEHVTPAWRPIALACNDQLAVFRADTSVDWTSSAPPPSWNRVSAAAPTGSAPTNFWSVPMAHPRFPVRTSPSHCWTRSNTPATAAPGSRSRGRCPRIRWWAACGGGGAP